MKNSWYKQPAFHWLLRLTLVAVALFFIRQKLNENLWESLRTLELNQPLLWCSTYLLLWLLNLALDAVLWQKAVAPLRYISLKSSFFNNLRFYAYSFISPANTGGLIARMSGFPSKEEKALASLLSAELGLARYLSRLSIGLGTVVVLLGLHTMPAAVALFAGILCFALFALFARYWKRLTQWLPWKKWLVKVKLIPNDKVLPAKATKHLATLFAWACLRFITYTSQFAVLLLLFGVPFQADIFLAIPAFFLLSNLLPSFPAADFLIKGAIGLAVFQYFKEAPALLLASTTLLWATNWALPALVGFGVTKK
jgi:hypothetical protein